MNIYCIRLKNHDNKIYDTIIIGAGASGISTGYHLKKYGVETLLLEARDRIGGRVFSSNDEFGYYLELGALFITDQANNPLISVAKLKGYKLVEKKFHDGIPYMKIGNEIINTKGKLHIILLLYKAMDIRKEFESWLLNNFDRLKDFTINKCILIYYVEKKLTLYYKVILKFIVSFYTVNTNDRTLSDVKIYIQEGGIGFKGDTFYNTDAGYINLLKPFTENLNINLSTEVNEVEKKNDHLIIKTNQGNFLTKKVVVTIPLSLLKLNTIKFPDNLIPSGVQKGIDTLSMFDMNKIFVEFEEKFWTNEEVFFFINDKASLYGEGINFYPVNGQNLIIFLVSGNQIEILQNKSLDELITEIENTISPFFLSSKVKVKKISKTDWKSDKYSRGSFTEVGGSDLKEIRRGFHENNEEIYFAGEHTSVEYNSFVYGAFESGKRAAKQILNSLNIPNTLIEYGLEQLDFRN